MRHIGDVVEGRREEGLEARGRVERLLELGVALPARDRALLEQVYRRGASAAELARMLRRKPEHVERRMRRILRRLRHPLFAYAARRMSRIPCSARPTARLV